ncbi:hypothetical protein Lal_00015840 [Lupinus albus]|nr:hypothetical protein Lal_00015840 [Lupinus albus]
MIELDAKDSNIDVDVIHKIGFLKDPIDRYFKHRSDQLDALVDIPPANKPEPQPSPFHIKTSSSSTMPTN